MSECKHCLEKEQTKREYAYRNNICEFCYIDGGDKIKHPNKEYCHWQKRREINDGGLIDVIQNINELTRIWIEEERQKTLDEVEKIVKEFRRADIPSTDSDNSHIDSIGRKTSRTYCNILPQHKDRIVVWFEQELSKLREKELSK